MRIVEIFYEIKDERFFARKNFIFFLLIYMIYPYVESDQLIAQVNFSVDGAKQPKSYDNLAQFLAKFG